MRSELVINGRFLTQPLSGMQRFAEELLGAFDELLTRDAALRSRVGSPRVFVPKGAVRSPRWQNITIEQVGSHTGHVWEQVDLAWAARGRMLLNLTAAGPLLHSRSIVVLHDAAIFAHPEHFSKKYILWHTFLRPRIAKRAIRLGTVSKFSRDELAKWCGVPTSKFEVIYDSAEHLLQCAPEPGVLEKNGLTPGQYALTVGNQSPNKNIALAVRAFLQAAPHEWKLAVVGGGANNVFAQTEQLDDHRVVRLGRISDGELRSLYEHSGLFLFPSRYEGFGVPPLEAMALGCPVVTSDASAMPEVLGDAAAFFRSDDLNDFCARIREVAADGELARGLVASGRARAMTFSWSNSAQHLVRLLEAAPLGQS